jgi:hypothetical protein
MAEQEVSDVTIQKADSPKSLYELLCNKISLQPLKNQANALSFNAHLGEFI